MGYSLLARREPYGLTDCLFWESQARCTSLTRPAKPCQVRARLPCAAVSGARQCHVLGAVVLELGLRPQLSPALGARTSYRRRPAWAARCCRLWYLPWQP